MPRHTGRGGRRHEGRLTARSDKDPMDQVIHCASCNSALKVPESLFGQMVRCPSCNATFEAGSGGVTAEPVLPRAEVYDEPPARRRRLREYDDNDDMDFRRRRPHRGGTILTLAIVGLIVCGPLALAA
jgi:hypothetical protein